MTVSKAQALVPDLRVEADDAPADAAALERLAMWLLQRVAPIVAGDPPDGIVIDSSGADHLHGGEAAMLEALAGKLALSGITVRLALADSWGAAHALARYGADSVTIVPPGGSDAALAPLPLEALRLPAATSAGLRDLGFNTVGDLMDQPRAPLTRRFGDALCRRLDQARVLTSEPIVPLRPVGLIEIRRAFAEPIAAPETIARYIGKLVVQLCAELAAKGLGARRLDLLCSRIDNRIEVLRVGLAVPQRDPARLTRLLCDRIITIDPGLGIEIMTLTATITDPLVPQQVATSLLEEATPDLSGLVDTLSNRFGARSVFRFAAVASEVPERAIIRIPPLAETDASGMDAWPDHWPRPSRLLPRPEPIETMALLPDHPPRWILWRGVRRYVQYADGPERIFGEWWKRDAEAQAVRDYFRIEDEAGARYWIFRQGDGEDRATGSHHWFLHGVFG